MGGIEHHELLRSASVVFGQSRYSEVTRRVLEAALAGRVVVTDRLPASTAIEELLPSGTHAVYYDGIDDAESKLRYYSDPANRESAKRIARAARERVLEHYTPRHVVDNIFAAVREFSSSSPSWRASSLNRALGVENVGEMETQRRTELAANLGMPFEIRVDHVSFADHEPRVLRMRVGESHIAAAARFCAEHWPGGENEASSPSVACIRRLSAIITSSFCVDDWCTPQPRLRTGWNSPSVVEQVRAPEGVSALPPLAVFLADADCRVLHAAGSAPRRRIREQCVEHGVPASECYEIIGLLEERCHDGGDGDDDGDGKHVHVRMPVVTRGSLLGVKFLVDGSLREIVLSHGDNFAERAHEHCGGMAHDDCVALAAAAEQQAAHFFHSFDPAIWGR